jgi:hypothetical protein
MNAIIKYLALGADLALGAKTSEAMPQVAFSRRA